MGLRHEKESSLRAQKKSRHRHHEQKRYVAQHLCSSLPYFFMENGHQCRSASLCPLLDKFSLHNKRKHYVLGHSDVDSFLERAARAPFFCHGDYHHRRDNRWPYYVGSWGMARESKSSSGMEYGLARYFYAHHCLTAKPIDPVGF